MISVIWLNYHGAEDCIVRGYWDQGFLELMFKDEIWHVPGTNPDFKMHELTNLDNFNEDGAIVILPARFHVDDVARINQDLAKFSWVLLILSSDEESLFPWKELSHPNMNLWISTPRPDKHEDVKKVYPDAKFIGEYFKSDTLELMPEREQERDFFFSGQGGHWRREAAISVLKGINPDNVVQTPGFTQGMERSEYLGHLAESKIAICPCGPVTPDSFRFYEALEAGCVPIADNFASKEGYPDGYWDMIFGTSPFTKIYNWGDVQKDLDILLPNWQVHAARCSEMWQGYKRMLMWDLYEDVQKLSGVNVFTEELPDDLITVLIPTSPIPSHPSTEIIEKTIESVRNQLPDAEIIVMVDGIREEQEDRRADYEEYVYRLTRFCAKQKNIIPLISESHTHQGNLTRFALNAVKTPLVLFVEHDTPLVDDPELKAFDWDSLCAAVRSGKANLIRFHHEAQVLDVHQYLMLDGVAQDVEGAPLLRTVQWSQRPHLASTGFYRTIIGSYFGTKSRTMIEDVMYGVLENAWRTHGVSGWEQFRTWMYAPDGNIKRSYHLDGRGTDEKFSMIVAYDNDVPEGAPAPGVM